MVDGMKRGAKRRNYGGRVSKFFFALVSDSPSRTCNVSFFLSSSFLSFTIFPFLGGLCRT